MKILNKKKNFFDINLLIAKKNYSKICNQIIFYKPKIFVILDKKTYKKVINRFKNSNLRTKIINDLYSLKLKSKNDLTISAAPGIAGLKPTILFIKHSKKILIANKEAIICGWNIIKKNSIKYNTKIIPVDSEHYSLLNLLRNHKKEEIEKIFITASGGPFLNLDIKKFNKITPRLALKHPKWKMGKKISIDSATLMNKILELIEAKKLFNLPNDMLEILIHPESLVHAIIKLKNGIIKFIYHETSMIVPLANAIFDEDLTIRDFLKIKKKQKFHNLSFNNVDSKIFPIIKVKNRLFEYPATPIILNAANEILVDQFLRKKIPFLSISKNIMTILNNRNYKKYAIREPKNLKDIFEIDQWAKNTTLKSLN